MPTATSPNDKKETNNKLRKEVQPARGVRLTRYRLGLQRRVSDRYPRTSNDRTYTLICISIIGLFLVALGITLVVIGAKKPIRDLLILGPLFLIAGVIFTIVNVVLWLRPLFRRRKVHIAKDQEASKNANQGYLRECDLNGFINPENQEKPTENELYVKKQPSTEHMDKNRIATPPPKIAMANDPCQTISPVYDLAIAEKVVLY